MQNEELRRKQKGLKNERARHFDLYESIAGHSSSAAGAEAWSECQDKLVEHKRYIDINGQDMPETKGMEVWGQARADKLLGT